jgi:transposase
VTKKIQQELPNLCLEFLPAYSPDLNTDWIGLAFL